MNTFVSGQLRLGSKVKEGQGGIWNFGDPKFKSGAGRPKTSGTQLPKINTIHKGTVVSVQEFGAFVQLGDGNTYRDGLMHVTCMMAERVENPDEYFKVGQKLWVKVNDVKDYDGKYGLDMRYVNQRDGRDLDPYNTRGRLPDNEFEGNAAFKRQLDKVQGKAEPLPVPEPIVAKKEEVKDEESEDSDERRKVEKRMKKAAKKLKKVRKKLEKVKKKLAKKVKKQSSSSSTSAEL